MVTETLTEVTRMVAKSLPMAKPAAHMSAMELHGAGVVKPDTEAEAKVDMPYEPISEIDPKDKGTPDEWVPRHPDLIRLTGRCAL